MYVYIILRWKKNGSEKYIHFFQKLSGRIFWSTQKHKIFVILQKVDFRNTFLGKIFEDKMCEIIVFVFI